MLAGRMIRSGIDRYAGSVRSVKVTESLFALTFDDGPHPANTIAILAVLAERGIHATFFMVADRAIAAPGVVAEVVHGGHEIGLHGRTHCDLTRVSSKRMWDEIRGGKHRLEHVVGRPVRWFRPPYGTQNLRSFVGARAAGLEVIGWTASPRDFLALGLDQHREVAERELAPGGILLLHDGPPSVPAYRTELAHAVLDDAARRGLRPTTVGDLMLNGDPHRERWFTTRAPAIIAELGPLYLRPETTPSSAATVTTWVASNQRTFTPPSS